MTDHRTCLWDETDQVIDQLAKVKAKQVKVITVAFGPYANLRQLKDIDDEGDVLHFGENERFKCVGKGLLHSKCPKNMGIVFETMRTQHMQLLVYAQTKHM